jgi:hypothetical protein
MTIKQVNAKADLLDKNSHTLAVNIIALALKNGPLDLDSLVKDTGIPEDKLKRFLGQMKNQVVQEGDKYKLK